MNGKLTPRTVVGAIAFLALVFAFGSGAALAHCGTCEAKCECGENCRCAARTEGSARTCKTAACECGETCNCAARKEGAACACKTVEATEATEMSPLVAAAKAKVEAAGFSFLTAQQLDARLKSKTPPVVIDVLSQKSFAASHIKGAINIPMSDIKKTAPTLLPDKNAAIVVYCGSYQCGASLNAAAVLKKLGYTNIHDYKGGLKEWTELGLPLVKPAVKE